MQLVFFGLLFLYQWLKWWVVFHLIDLLVSDRDIRSSWNRHLTAYLASF